MPRPPTGVRRSDPAKLARLVGAHLHPAIGTAMAAPPALYSDLTPYLSPRKDQGQTGTCSCHALSTGAYAAQKLAGIQTPLDASPHVLYSVSGRIEVGHTGPLWDNGRQLVDVLEAARTVGLAPQQGPTPDGRNSDVWSDADTGGTPPGNVCVDATPAELGAANLHEFDFGHHTIDPTAADVEAQVIATLTAQVPAPILLGTLVGQQFEAAGPGTIVEPAGDDSTAGGHALLIVGHRTLADGTRQFRVCNSWSGSWGESGEIWASSAWLRACWELHPITMTPKGPDPRLSLLQRIKAALGIA
jgi:hypothetical protein